MILTEQIGEVKRLRLARTLFGRGWYFTAAYLVDELIIDTGCSHTADELIEVVDGSQIARAVITHSHEDHIGGNAVLQSRFGVEILAHPLALPFLADPSKWNLRPYQRIAWGKPLPSSATPLGAIVESRNHRFQVIHTPGHSPDHVCFYEPDEGWLFTGDTFIGGKDRTLREDYNIWQIIDSLKKLAALDTGTLFSGSGTVRPNGKQEIISKIEYLEELGQKVLELHARDMSFSAIRRTLFGGEVMMAYITLGHFNGWHLVRSYVEDQPGKSKPHPTDFSNDA